MLHNKVRELLAEAYAKHPVTYKEMNYLKLSVKMSKVVADLEYLIGSECYNPNSYDGWNDIEGCDFRYPINIPDQEGRYRKIRENLNTSLFVDASDITPDAVTYMKYRFGSNELYIGRGIIKVLEYLENRYGLDFDELETKHVDK